MNQKYFKMTRNLSSAILKSQSQKKINTSLNLNYSELNSNNSNCILPPIDSKIKQKALLESTSFLTKFVNKQTSNLIRLCNKEIKFPKKLKKFPSSDNYKKLDRIWSNKSNIKKRNQSNETMNEELLIYENLQNISPRENISKSYSNKSMIFITQKNKENLNTNFVEQSQITNDVSYNINNLNNFNNNDLMNSSEQIDSSSVINNNLNNKKDNNNQIINSKNNSKKNLNNNNFLSYLNSPNFYSMSIYHKLKPKEKDKLINRFRRVCTFVPLYDQLWKFKNGLRQKNKNPQKFLYKEDNEYQLKLITDEIKLFLSNYNQYRIKITKMTNLKEIFTSMPLNSKIKYNKALEEICGILLKLPELFLMDYYKKIGIICGIKTPNKEKFKDKYIFDEVENLDNNHSLLYEVIDYFKNCFEFYKVIIMEINVVDRFTLNKDEFYKIMTFLDKARYDISYLLNSLNNGTNSLNEDLSMINKLDTSKKKYYKKTEDIQDKMFNQLLFKKSDEKEKIERIKRTLDIIDESDDENEINKRQRKNNSCLMNPTTKNLTNRKKFNSIIDSKVITNLLKYYNKDRRSQIITRRYEKEMKDDDENQEYKVIKIDI